MLAGSFHKLVHVVIFATVITLMQGCAAIMPVPGYTSHPLVTSMNFDPSTMVLIGPTEGASLGGSLAFGLLPVYFDDGIITATKNALKKSGGDALLGPVVDDEEGSFLALVQWHEVKVWGTAVRFKTSPEAGAEKTSEAIKAPESVAVKAKMTKKGG